MMTQPDVAPATPIARLPDLATTLLGEASRASSQRSGHTVFGGRDRIMRQTLVALAAGAELAEHDSPGEATLFVLDGQVTLRTIDGTTIELRAGDHVEIPPARHSVHAVTDVAFLLTAVPRENVQG